MTQRTRIFLTKPFYRWARSEGIPAGAIRVAVQEIASGLFDADLGGGLYKKRVPRAGMGKRGGFRTLVASNRDDRWFFVYGFAKNQRANIDASEERALKRLASELFDFSPDMIDRALGAAQLFEVPDDEQAEISHPPDGP